jgi:hypothetical protein
MTRNAQTALLGGPPAEHRGCVLAIPRALISVPYMPADDVHLGGHSRGLRRSHTQAS